MVLILSAPYNALIIAHEQMKAFAYISIFEAVSRLSIAYLIQWTSWDKLIVYAVLLLFLQLIVRLCYSMYCRRNFPESRAPLRYEKHRLKEMFAYSGWTSLGHLAIVGYTQGLNILLNIFLRFIAIMSSVSSVLTFCSPYEFVCLYSRFFIRFPKTISIVLLFL